MTSLESSNRETSAKHETPADAREDVEDVNRTPQPAQDPKPEPKSPPIEEPPPENPDAPPPMIQDPPGPDANPIDPRIFTARI